MNVNVTYMYVIIIHGHQGFIVCIAPNSSSINFLNEGLASFSPLTPLEIVHVHVSAHACTVYMYMYTSVFYQTLHVHTMYMYIVLYKNVFTKSYVHVHVHAQECPNLTYMYLHVQCVNNFSFNGM